MQPFPNGSPAIIYHPCVEQIAKRYTDLDRAIERGKVDVSSALSAYAHVVKDNKLGMARLASAVPTSANDGEMSIPFILTTLQEDRDGDVVIPMGCQLDEYADNPVIFFGHQSHPIPIATAKSPDGRLAVYPEENLIRGVAYFDKADADAVFIYGKVKRGFLNATSIAFVPIQAIRRDREQEKGLYERGHTHSDPGAPAGWVFKAYSLTEWSIVGVPSNAGAIRDSLDTEKSFISPKLQKAMTPYAAKAIGRCFSGWCPTPAGICVPCEKTMQPVAKKLDIATEAAALKKLGDDAIRELQSLKEGSPKQSDAAKRLADEATRYIDQLASRVTSAADAKRLAQALGRSGTENGKDNLLKGIRLAIVGRIGSYVRVHASYEGSTKKNLCGCKDAKVGQACSCKNKKQAKAGGLEGKILQALKSAAPSYELTESDICRKVGEKPGSFAVQQAIRSLRSQKLVVGGYGGSAGGSPVALTDAGMKQVGKSIKSSVGKAKNELPTRPVEPIYERTLRETFNGDTRVTQLPEWDAWKRAVHHQYVELRTADERLAARSKFERAFADLKAAYARLPKKSLRKSPSVLNNAIRQAISAGYSQVQDYAGDWNELVDWVRSQKQGWDWESAQVSGDKLVAVDDGGVRYTFALRKSKKQLLESSGPAGGYTVAVEQGTEAISTPGDMVCSQCTGNGNCPGCGGVGEFNDMPCDACNGSGACSMCSGEGIQAKSTNKGTNVATRKNTRKIATKKAPTKAPRKQARKKAYEEDDHVGNLVVLWETSSNKYYVNSVNEINQDHHLAGPFATQEQAFSWARSNQKSLTHRKAGGTPYKSGYSIATVGGEITVYHGGTATDAPYFSSIEDAKRWIDREISLGRKSYKSAEEVAVAEDKGADDSNAMPFTPKPSALEAAKAYQHLKDLADYYGPGGEGDLEKMDHPGMHAALKDFLEDDVPKAMEKIKSSILEHHKSDDDPEVFMEKLCKALGGADEFETGEAGMVENGDVPPVVEDDFEVEEELLDEEESDGEIDKSEVGSEEWAEEEAAEPQHKEEEEVIAEYEDGDDVDPDTEEILERYQHPKSGKWMTRKVGTARRAKDGNVYISRSISKGPAERRTGESWTAASPSDRLNALIKLYSYGAGVPTTSEQARLESLSKMSWDALPDKVRTGLTNKVPSIKSHTLRKDLNDPGSEDGAGDPMLNEGNPEELKDIGDEVDDVEMDLDNEGNPEELKAGRTRASDLQPGYEVTSLDGSKTGKVVTVDSDGWEAKVQWSNGKVEYVEVEKLELKSLPRKSLKPRPVSPRVANAFTDFKKTLSRLGVKLNGSAN